ncbi:hypothetical protein HKX48_003959 [Thoreauomyces humboldtii]|nr:hypothetical protein HKX48_003959 [Thoreauomyces humboldtii]
MAPGLVAAADRLRLLVAVAAECGLHLQRSLLDSVSPLGVDVHKPCRQTMAHLDEQQRLYQKDPGNQAAITALQKFENGLLYLFRTTFEFFGAHEFEDLKRLRSDRHRCAHPTFSQEAVPFTPTAEHARMHIRSAITFVLSQPPKQGRAALASLRALVESPCFPSTHDEAVVRFRHSELWNARQGLVTAFLQDLIFKWDWALNHQASAFIAIRAIIELHHQHAIPKIQNAIQSLAKGPAEDLVARAADLALAVPAAAELVDDATQSTLRTWLQREGGNAKGISIMHESPERITPGELPAEMVTQAARIYITARNYQQANEMASHMVLPLANRFSRDDIALILGNARAPALFGSFRFGDFVDALRDVWSDEELRALLAEHNFAIGENGLVDLTL